MDRLLAVAKRTLNFYDENQWVLYNQDQTKNLQLIGSYKVTPTQERGVRFQFVTGDPTTPVDSVRYDATSRRYIPCLRSG